MMTGHRSSRAHKGAHAPEFCASLKWLIFGGSFAISKGRKTDQDAHRSFVQGATGIDRSAKLETLSASRL